MARSIKSVGETLDIARPTAGECHLWWATAEDGNHGIQQLLDPTDIAEDMDGLQAGQNVDAAVVGRGLARIVLGRYLDRPPRAVQIVRDCESCGEPHGKPRLREACGLEFSISHCGDTVVVACTAECAVGVDIELTFGRPPSLVQALSADVLTEDERVDVAGPEPNAVVGRFLQLWTRKEAVLKAAGVGLAVSPVQIGVGIVAGPPCITRLPPALCHLRFRLHDIVCHLPHLVGALAISAPLIAVRSFDGSRLLADAVRSL